MDSNHQHSVLKTDDSANWPTRTIVGAEGFEPTWWLTDFTDRLLTNRTTRPSATRPMPFGLQHLGLLPSIRCEQWHKHLWSQVRIFSGRLMVSNHLSKSVKHSRYFAPHCASGRVRSCTISLSQVPKACVSTFHHRGISRDGRIWISDTIAQG